MGGSQDFKLAARLGCTTLVDFFLKDKIVTTYGYNYTNSYIYIYVYSI